MRGAEDQAQLAGHSVVLANADEDVAKEARYLGSPEHGITTDAQSPTGIALILVEDSGQNAIAVVPGANLQLRVADTTGAGDAFNAGRAAALVRGEPMESAIDHGCQAGAFCVTCNGVIDGLAYPSDLTMQRLQGSS